MQHLGTTYMETDRLILRKFNLDDAEAMFANWACDEQVTKYLTWPTHKTINDTIAILGEWTAAYTDNYFYQWAIVSKANADKPIGSISVVSFDDKVKKAQIGYCIGRQWWGKGITAEALQKVINFLFDEVGMQRIEARHDIKNPNSGVVMKKCGMKYEGTLRKADWNNQGICDVCYYSLLLTDR